MEVDGQTQEGQVQGGHLSSPRHSSDKKKIIRTFELTKEGPGQKGSPSQKKVMQGMWPRLAKFGKNKYGHCGKRSTLHLNLPPNDDEKVGVLVYGEDGALYDEMKSTLQCRRGSGELVIC